MPLGLTYKVCRALVNLLIIKFGFDLCYNYLILYLNSLGPLLPSEYIVLTLPIIIAKNEYYALELPYCNIYYKLTSIVKSLLYPSISVLRTISWRMDRSSSLY